MSSKSTITPEQLENYRAVNRRMGVHEDLETPRAKLPHALSGDGKDNTVIFSGDSKVSHYKPHLIMVNSIADYNQMIGAPDDQADDHVAYPEPLSDTMRTKVASQEPLTDEEHAVVQKAKYAYLQGNPAKVKEYEPLIDEHLFPQTVAYFATTDNMTISTPTQVTGEVPVVWNLNSLTIDQSGSLTAISTEFTMTANQLESVNDSGTDKTISAIGGPQVNPTAQAGTAGGTGGSGDQGSSAVCGQDSGISGTPTVCKTAPGNGTVGLVGGNGGNGTPGIKGNAQLPFNTTINQAITGNLVIQGGGGTGQNGGPGGNGGNGGAGGAAGVNCTQCTAASAGTQGPGGNGGNGAAAGNGGDGAAINVTYASLAGNLTTSYIGGQPGMAGAGGQPGTGGTGTTGSNGANGVAGAQSTITVTQIPS